MSTRGVTREMMEAAMDKPIVVIQQGPNRFLYLGTETVVVVQRDGIAITAYPSAEYTGVVRALSDFAARK